MAKKKAAAKKTSSTAQKKSSSAKKTSPRWKCPKCGRSFAKKNQWHSCQTAPVDTHFKDKDPNVRKIYDSLVKELEKFGRFRADAVKSSINLINKYHFGSVTVQEKALRLGFVSDEKARSARIVQTQELGPNRVGHSVKLESPDDVDEQLLGWLHRAYELQG